MAVHDELAPAVQRLLTDGPFDFSALKVRDYQRANGPAATVTQVRRSFAAEVQRFDRERAAALAWAREKFNSRRR